MVPVKQTRYGKGHGNCLLACVASILHRPLESIPDFAMSGCGWFEELYEWCLNEDIGVALIHPKDFEHSLFLNIHGIMIFTVAGMDDEDHAVIGKCVREENNRPDENDKEKWRWHVEVVHDPNPRSPKVDKLEHLLFLVPKVSQ